MRLLPLALTLVPLAVPSFALPEATPATEPTLEKVMSDPVWIGRLPESAWWDDDGQRVWLEREAPSGIGLETLEIRVATGESRVVDDAELSAVPGPGGQRSADGALRTWTRAGDVFWRELPDGPIRQLTRTTASETEPRFLVEPERRIAFHRDGSWFVRDLDTGLENEPVPVAGGVDPESEKEEDERTWLENQQLRLFDVLRERRDERIAERERDAALRRADPTRAARTVYLGEGVEIASSHLSPTGRSLVVVTESESRDHGPRDRMPTWVTESGYVEVDEVRPKVGTSDGTGQSLLLLDAVTGVRHDIDLSVLPGIADRPLVPESPADASEEDQGSDDPGPRSVEIEIVEWAPDGMRVAVQAHSLDNKDRWIFLLEPSDESAPELVPLHRLHDPAWVSWYFNELGWLPDASTLWFLSEETGSSQLWLADVETGDLRRLSSGEGVVSDPEPSLDGSRFVYSANHDDPRVWELWSVDVATGAERRLTNLGGAAGVSTPPIQGRVVQGVWSPDGQRVLFTHSTPVRPPEIWTAGSDGRDVRALTASTSDEFRAIEWVEPVAVAVPSSEIDDDVYGRYYPPSGDGPLAGAAVVFVHGAGYLQNAHRGWSGYFREFMFHTVLSRQGAAVLDLDFRGSAGYGRDWRTAIYRRMGHPELVDLADGVDWLVAEHGVDPERVGVYGGSYGGFLTMMSLFREPDLFASGAALRPVTDWAHYNHPYTSNILDTPETAPEAYRISSPIEWADGLSAPLLIAAPMLDDNVFFQDTVRLAQRFIELGKKDWDVALYPVEAHGFVEPSSWFHEYRRIEALFLETLSAAAPADSRPGI